jgi:long-subunit fatty acid transport protein
VGQSDGETYRNEITHELDDVLNFGLGIENIFNENITLYGSVRTDFSARKKGSDTTLTVTDWDIYHIMAGTTFRIKNTEWTLGLGYSWGRSGKAKTPSIDDPHARYQIRDFFQNVDFAYSSINILFGFSF